MDDSDETPPLRPMRRIQSQDDRDLEGLAERRRRHNAPARGVPIDQVDDLAEELPPPPNDEITGPQEVEAAYGPLTDQNRAIWARIDRIRREELAKARAARERADGLLKAVGELPTPEQIQAISGRLDDVDKRDARRLGHFYWALRGVIGAFGMLAMKAVIVLRAFDALEARTHENAARIQLIEQVLFLRTKESFP